MIWTGNLSRPSSPRWPRMSPAQSGEGCANKRAIDVGLSRPRAFSGGWARPSHSTARDHDCLTHGAHMPARTHELGHRRVGPPCQCCYSPVDLPQQQTGASWSFSGPNPNRPRGNIYSCPSFPRPLVMPLQALATTVKRGTPTAQARSTEAGRKH